MATSKNVLAEMKSPEEMRAYIINKAKDDETFRSQLLADPKEALKQEFDITLPSSFNLQVHEDSATSAHIVLPPTQNLNLDLSVVQGGAASCHTGSGGCIYEA